MSHFPDKNEIWGEKENTNYVIEAFQKTNIKVAICKFGQIKYNHYPDHAFAHPFSTPLFNDFVNEAVLQSDEYVFNWYIL